MNSKKMEFFNDLIYRKQLGGLTNINLLVSHNKNEYVLRYPSLEFEGIIDWKNEKYNNQIAVDHGVAPANIVFTDEGVKVTPYYSATEDLTRDSLKEESYLKKIGQLFCKLHSVQQPFATQFDYWIEVEKYKSVLDELPSMYKKLEQQVRLITGQESTCYVPCHIDPLPENYIQDDACNLFLIDWEYSANYLSE